MRNRIYWLVIVVLVGTSIFLLNDLSWLSGSPTELILNEKGYLEIVNENEVQRILSVRTSIDKATSKEERVLEARHNANRAAEIVENIHHHFQEIAAFTNYSDSIGKKFTLISREADVISGLGPGSRFLKRKEYQLVISDPRLFRNSQDYQHLPLVLLENNLLQSAGMLMDSLSAICEGVNFKFDILTNITTSAGPSWIKGQIVFNPPGLMNLYQKERVQVRISRKFSRQLAATMNRKETVMSDSLPVGDIMSVKLLGDDFDIVAYDDEEQGVTADDYTQWEFDVTPKVSGNHNLYIKAGIVYYVPNLGPAKKYFPVYEKVVNVEVSAWQMVSGFATERWEFLLSSIVIPLGVWAYSRFRAGRKTTTDSKSP